LDKICESNNDCTENEFCDSVIGICICANGFQLDNSKQYCLSTTGNMASVLNNSGYDITDVANYISSEQPQQLQQSQLDTFKKVNVKYLLFIISFIKKLFKSSGIS
jgi:hypothetical protein